MTGPFFQIFLLNVYLRSYTVKIYDEFSLATLKLLFEAYSSRK